MIRRLLAALSSRGEMPDPVDDHWHSAAELILGTTLPRTPGEKFADDVEHWLCSQTCNHEES